MALTNKLYRGIAQSLEVLPKGKVTAGRLVGKLLQGTPFWDPWIFKDGDIYRLFYLVGTEGVEPWWSRSRICGAISTDFKQWKDLGSLIEPEPGDGWECGRIFAGCTHKEDGVYYLFYSGSGKGQEIGNEMIGLATSTDALYWVRHSPLPFLKPEESDRWYGRNEQANHFHWRDPYIVKEDNTGKYYMFISASSKAGKPSRYRGCIGLAVADKINGPYELLPPAAMPVVDGTNESPYYEMERPQVIYRDGQYHLFFSCWTKGLNPKWLQQVGREKITDSSLYWYVSNQITGPFKPVTDKPVVSGSEKTGMYGINFFPSPSKPEEFMAYGWYFRLHSLEILPAFQVSWLNNKITIG